MAGCQIRMDAGKQKPQQAQNRKQQQPCAPEPEGLAQDWGGGGRKAGYAIRNQQSSDNPVRRHEKLVHECGNRETTHARRKTVRPVNSGLAAEPQWSIV